MSGRKIYVLRLENEKYYVGRTKDFSKRYDQHLKGRGSPWTQINKPIGTVLINDELLNTDENEMTFRMMALHGIDNVRGGSYCMLTFTQNVLFKLQHQISRYNEILIDIVNDNNNSEPTICIDRMFNVPISENNQIPQTKSNINDDSEKLTKKKLVLRFIEENNYVASQNRYTKLIALHNELKTWLKLIQDTTIIGKNEMSKYLKEEGYKCNCTKSVIFFIEKKQNSSYLNQINVQETKIEYCGMPQYANKNSLILRFLNENGYVRSKKNRIKLHDLYTKFEEWLKSVGDVTKIGKNEFSRYLKSNDFDYNASGTVEFYIDKIESNQINAVVENDRLEIHPSHNNIQHQNIESVSSQTLPNDTRYLPNNIESDQSVRQSIDETNNQMSSDKDGHLSNSIPIIPQSLISGIPTIPQPFSTIPPQVTTLPVQPPLFVSNYSDNTIMLFIQSVILQREELQRYKEEKEKYKEENERLRKQNEELQRKLSAVH